MFMRVIAKCARQGAPTTNQPAASRECPLRLASTFQLRSLVRCATNSGKRPAVRHWVRADHCSEVFAHHGGGPESRFRRHSLDRQVRRFEQPLRAPHARVREPRGRRRTLNAIILAGASGVYLSGGFGLWELVYPVIGTAIGLRALWFLAGAPSFLRQPHAAMRAAGA